MLKLRINAFEIGLGAAATNPSLYPFTALITYGGKASDRYVGGSEAVKGGPYRVQIPGELLKAKIADLKGKRVFANDDLDSHVKTRCIGRFVDAWVEGQEGTEILAAKASGFLDRTVDEDLVDEIVAAARDGKLGFSYDLKSVSFELKASSDEGSEEQCMVLTDFQWRGATILKREVAAYQETQLAAAAASHRDKPDPEEEQQMDPKEFERLLNAAVQPLVTKLTSIETEVNSLKGNQAKLEASVTAIKAPATPATPEKETKPATPEATPAARNMSVSDLAASIAEGIGAKFAEPIKTLAEAVAKLGAKGEEPPVNTRKSRPAHELQLMAKYQPDLKDDDEVTPEHYTGMIHAVNADATLTRAAKAQVLQTLGAARRRMEKAQRGGAR